MVAGGDILGYVIQGVFIAIGTVIGTYFSNRVLIRQFETAVGRVRRIRR